MPTVKLNKSQVLKYIGKKISDNELRERIPMIGVDLEDINKDEIIVEIFPNRPDMMSDIGFSRALSSFLGIKTGLRKYIVKKSNEKIIINKNLKNIRPYTAAAIVKNLKLDNEKIKEIIQIQEKLHITYGRNRKKCAIGVYPLENIKFPIRFMALEPEKIVFKPLDFNKEINAREILEKHPAGKEYGYLLKNLNMFPVFIDANNNVLSLTPVINSEYTGRITEKTKDVFIEVSGYDLDVCKRCLNIIVTALYDMKGEIYSLILDYSGKKIISPDLKPEKIKINLSYINKIIGVELKDNETKKYLERMGYGFNKEKKEVLIPVYRTDILHEIDIAEDITIAYGYNNFKVEIPNIATIGEEDKFECFKNKIAEVLIGLGLIEVNSFSISNKEVLNSRMNFNNDFIQLQNALTSEYNVLRNFLIPSLFEVLERNRHNDYPQKIFEIGKIFVKSNEEETGVKEINRLAVLSCHANVNYTEVKQFLDALFNAIGLKISIENAEHGSFIGGRIGNVFIDGKDIGFIGEFKPEIITNFNLDMPVSGFEIDLDKIFRMIF